MAGSPSSSAIMATVDQPTLAGPGLSFMHLNAQSLFPKINEMQLMVENVRPDLLCISETWLTPSIKDMMVNISDYIIVRHDRATHRRGGGLATYIKSNVLSGADIYKHHNLWISNHDVANILDLVFSNSKSILKCGSWSTHISDHEPVYVIRKKRRMPLERTTFKCRNFHNYQKEEFQMDLCAYNWGDFF